jgi:integrase
MNFYGVHYANLEQNKSGFYWKPPPAARAVFTSSPLGKELNRDALAQYYRRQEALAQWRLERKGLIPGAKPIGPDTVDSLFRDYQSKSIDVLQCAERTKTEYRRSLTALADFPLQDGTRFGDQPWATLRGSHADALYFLFRENEDGKERDVYARGVFAVARQAYYWAKRGREKEWKMNPFAEMGLKVPKGRKVKWTAVEVWAFINKAEQMGAISVGMAAVLCYELGQRVSDARKSTRSMFEMLPDGRMGVLVEQQKTGVELLLPVSDVLAAWLKKIPADQELLVVNEQTGQPYKDWELSKRAGEIRAAAGIRAEVRVGDLRRTCLTELGRAGGTDDELVSVSGHSDRKVLSIYSRPEYEKALRVMAARWKMRSAA